MQAGVDVRIASADDLNGKTGIILHRMIDDPHHLERNRYLVKLDSDETVRVDLENLICTNEDCFEDDSPGGMAIANGLCFCASHRLEICGSCGYNFRMQNLMSELPQDYGFDRLDALVERIENQMNSKGSPIRKGPRFGEKSSAAPRGASRLVSLPQEFLVPGGLDPSKLSTFDNFVYEAFHLRGLKLSAPEIATTIKKLAELRDNSRYREKPICVGLQNAEQTDVMWVRFIADLSLKEGSNSIPLLVIRWVCGNAGNPMALFSYLEAGVDLLEIRVTAAGIHAFRDLLQENGNRLDQDYVARMKRQFRPDGWNISVLRPMREDSTPECCDHCGRSGVSLKKCSRCKVAKYCGKECQGKAWKRHKKVCQPA